MKQRTIASPLHIRVTSFCTKHALIQPTDTVVVGFSGGPDSLFLLTALATWLPPQHIIAAHLDHGWRQESHTEALWCKAKAESLGVRFEIGSFNDYACTIKNTGSQEDRGRQARRLFFKHVATHYGAQSIALAHHADDALETFFIRLIRGAGVQGLAGMRPRHGTYIRPLLELTKQEIISFLDTHHIDYLTDPSNVSQNYLRNRIRATIMPALMSCDPRAQKNILNAISCLQEADSYLDAQTHTAYTKLLRDFPTENTSLSKNLLQSLSVTPQITVPALDLFTLESLQAIIRHRVLVTWLCNANVPFTPTKAFFTEIERFLFTSRVSTTHQIAPGWVIRKKAGAVQLIPQSN
jgi:tRNA(Ile)-lysidine synthase